MSFLEEVDVGAKRNRYGSFHSESEALLGATMEDIDYVKFALDELTEAELLQFQNTLTVLYKMVDDRLREKNAIGSQFRAMVNMQLDKVLNAHGAG